jgi:hypothetical protein
MCYRYKQIFLFFTRKPPVVFTSIFRNMFATECYFCIIELFYQIHFK